MSRTVDYLDIVPRSTSSIPNPQTQMIIHYKDNFGCLKEFICCAALNLKDQGQSTDTEVKRHMKRLGISVCRVEYRDWTWETVRWFDTDSVVPHELRPRRKWRTIRLW